MRICIFLILILATNDQQLCSGTEELEILISRILADPLLLLSSPSMMCATLRMPCAEEMATTSMVTVFASNFPKVVELQLQYVDH